MNKYTKIFILVIALLPSVSFAAFDGIGGLLEALQGIINTLFPILAGLALLAFLWGLAKFIFRVGGDEKAVEGGKKLMVWGVIALFVMVSIWGIVAFIGDAFGIDSGESGGTLFGGGAA